MITKEYIDSELCAIFKNILGVDFIKNSNLKDQKLFGKQIKLSARELVHLYYAIETKFQIKIDKNIILEGRFDTYNNILDILSQNVL